MVFSSGNQSVAHSIALPPVAGATTLLQRRCVLSSRRLSRRNHLVTFNSSCNSSQETSSQSSLLSVFCPLLRLVAGGDAAAPRRRWFEVASSGLASVSRLPFGVSVGDEARSRANDPPKALQLYEFEACPFCRCQPGPAEQVTTPTALHASCWSCVALISGVLVPPETFCPFGATMKAEGPFDTPVIPLLSFAFLKVFNLHECRHASGRECP